MLECLCLTLACRWVTTEHWECYSRCPVSIITHVAKLPCHFCLRQTVNKLSNCIFVLQLSQPCTSSYRTIERVLTVKCLQIRVVSRKHALFQRKKSKSKQLYTLLWAISLQWRMFYSGRMPPAQSNLTPWDVESHKAITTFWMAHKKHLLRFFFFFFFKSICRGGWDWAPLSSHSFAFRCQNRSIEILHIGPNEVCKKKKVTDCCQKKQTVSSASESLFTPIAFSACSSSHLFSLHFQNSWMLWQLMDTFSSQPSPTSFSEIEPSISTNMQ